MMNEPQNTPPATPDQAEILFAEGLIGLPHARRFRLLQAEREDLLLLECLDDDRLCLPVINPRAIFDDYQPQLRRSSLGELRDADPSQLLMLAITVVEPSGDSQVNLRAPLVIDIDRNSGIQVILEDKRYSLAAPLSLASPA